MFRPSLWTLILTAILTLSCSRTKTDLDAFPDSIEPGDLFKVIHGFPDDTSGGLHATGRWRPEDASSAEGEKRAQQGALARIYSSLRSQGPSSEGRFYNCLGREVAHAYVKIDTLAHGVCELTILIPREFVSPLKECLGQSD